MAIQSQLYSENFEFGWQGKGVVCQEHGFGFGFDNEMNFNLQQQQKQQFMEFQPQQQQHHQFQFLPQKYESLCFQKNGFTNQSLNLSATISAQMEKQRQEIDQFLSVQVIYYLFDFSFSLLLEI